MNFSLQRLHARMRSVPLWWRVYGRNSRIVRLVSPVHRKKFRQRRAYAERAMIAIATQAALLEADMQPALFNSGVFRAGTISALNLELTRYLAEGAPRAIFEMECMTCHAQSDATDNDPSPAREWALMHRAENPKARVFKLHTETYWTF